GRPALVGPVARRRGHARAHVAVPEHPRQRPRCDGVPRTQQLRVGRVLLADVRRTRLDAAELDALCRVGCGCDGAAARRAAPAMKQIIIDCDPGQDDAIALLLALASGDEVDVLAVTTVAGTVSERAANHNARKILEVAGRRDIPVHAGCDRPLLRPHVPYFGDDADGLRGVALPEPVAQPGHGHAVDA